MYLLQYEFLTQSHSIQCLITLSYLLPLKKKKSKWIEPVFSLHKRVHHHKPVPIPGRSGTCGQRYPVKALLQNNVMEHAGGYKAMRPRVPPYWSWATSYWLLESFCVFCPPSIWNFPLLKNEKKMLINLGLYWTPGNVTTLASMAEWKGRRADSLVG